MSDIIISAEQVSKRFYLSHEGQERYTALRDVIIQKAKGIFRAPSRTLQSEEFWALKDVSFDIRQGDRVGIIGRNGAGKSTLLKILSRITEPTSGSIRIKGRVASLLEVGTGFHPELTGRENIFLNGAILGMSREEIRSKFDEIVDFAEVERFLDTPVKRYSSGMYVRLAFAVAAHLEPEILIVDEVLAVGDAQFQKKCLGKMDDVSRKEGRTVLFVSHNMAAIQSLCTRGILMQGGKVRLDGSAAQAVAAYLSSGASEGGDTEYRSAHYAGSPKPCFAYARLQNPELKYGDTLQVALGLYSPYAEKVAVEMELYDEQGNVLSYSSTAPMQEERIELDNGALKEVVLNLEDLKLASGNYFIRFWLIKPWAEEYDVISDPLSFEITYSDPYETGFEFKQSYRRGAFHHHIRINEI